MKKLRCTEFGVLMAVMAGPARSVQVGHQLTSGPLQARGSRANQGWGMSGLDSTGVQHREQWGQAQPTVHVGPHLGVALRGGLITRGS